MRLGKLVVSPLDAVFSFLLILLVIFPKAGIRVGGIPITLCYLAVLFFACVCFVLIAKRKIISKASLLAYLSSLPFQFFIVYDLLNFGYKDVGFTFSFLLSFILFPLVFLILFCNAFAYINTFNSLRTLKICIFLVSAYGIFQFFYTLKTGNFLDIPYVTYDPSDFVSAAEKNNDRGGVFKLVSTYNNGNIYGVCLIMLLPVYSVIERNGLFLLLLKFSLLLTLSRTVWIGLILFEFFSMFFLKVPSSSGKYVNLMSKVFLLFLIFFGIIFAIGYLGYDQSFLFDSKLGGRSEQLSILNNFSLIPDSPFVGIEEIVYMAMLRQFGLLGLIFFVVAMMAPIIISIIVNPRENLIYRSFVFGLILYLIVASSDGAIINIPVMGFYWLICAFLLSRNFRHIDDKL